MRKWNGSDNCDKDTLIMKIWSNLRLKYLNSKVEYKVWLKYNHKNLVIIMAFVSLTTRLARPHPLERRVSLYKKNLLLVYEAISWFTHTQIVLDNARLYTACRFDSLRDFPVSIFNWMAKYRKCNSATNEGFFIFYIYICIENLKILTALCYEKNIAR